MSCPRTLSLKKNPGKQFKGFDPFYLTLSKTKKIDSSKRKEFPVDNFKFEENGRKFSKQVENTVGEKGEIARHEQFLLLPLCFQKTFIADT